MDPKSLSSLDPKLKETYERVMGTSVPQQAPTAPATPVVEPENNVPVTPAPPISEPAEQPVQANTSPFMASSMGQPLPNPAEMQQQAASPMLKIAYIVGGIIFFIVYTIFWIKIFNLPFIF